jgi:hypothetical protein
MSNPNGRPPHHNQEAIAKDLVEWSKLDTSTNLNGFCGSRGLAPSYITRWARENPQFCLAYEEAKANIGQRREERLSAGTLHVKAYDLNANVYDHFRKDEMQQQQRFEMGLDKEKTEHKAKVDSEVGETVTKNIVDMFDSTMKQIKGLQNNAQVALNKEESSNISE